MFFSYGLAGDCDIRVHGFQNSKSVSDFENAIANRKNGWIIWKSLDVLEFAKDVSDFENSSMFGKRYLNNRNISRIAKIVASFKIIRSAEFINRDLKINRGKDLRFGKY
jgi:hypothetical protein